MNDAKFFWWISVERVKAKSKEEIRGNSYQFQTGVRNPEGFFYLINLRLKLERNTDISYYEALPDVCPHSNLYLNERSTSQTFRIIAKYLR